MANIVKAPDRETRARARAWDAAARVREGRASVRTITAQRERIGAQNAAALDTIMGRMLRLAGVPAVACA